MTINDFVLDSVKLKKKVEVLEGIFLSLGGIFGCLEITLFLVMRFQKRSFIDLPVQKKISYYFIWCSSRFKFHLN